MSSVERDPSTGAWHFRALLSTVREAVPEVDEWWAEWTDGETMPLTLGDLSRLVDLRLFDHGTPRFGDADVWARLLRVVEVSLLLQVLLSADERRHDDAVEVDAFAGAGVICDVTRTRESLELLLPWMGPESGAAARSEVVAHSVSRGFVPDDVDWTSAGARFVPLDVEPATLAPNVFEV